MYLKQNNFKSLYKVNKKVQGTQRFTGKKFHTVIVEYKNDT